MSSGVAFVSGIIGAVVGAMAMQATYKDDLKSAEENARLAVRQAVVLQEKVDELELDIDDLRDRLGAL